MGTGPPIRRAPKPTRVAHLSDYMPTRIYWNFPTVTAWLYDQQFQCVLDAIEQQVISGDGSVENMTGILATSGTTDIAFNTDLPTTLRSAVSALQNLGETPTVLPFSGVPSVTGRASTLSTLICRYFSNQ
jgi:hypothetical protein